MTSIRENLWVENYVEETGQVKMSVNFDSINMLEEKKNKSCSLNKNKSNSINDVLESQIANSNLNLNPNMVETEVILDKSTQSQLTPKFIKSNSTSEWSKLFKAMEHLYSSENSSEFNFELANEIALKFSTQLLADYALYEKNEPISDCGLFAPRLHCTYNNQTRPLRIVNELVNLMYVKTNRVTKFENGKVMYSKLISRLSKRYVEQFTKDFLANNKYKLFRLLEHDRKNWCSLKNKPVGKVITEPTAMPVEIAPLEELEPFFKFLDSNAQPIDNDNEIEPCMKFIRGALYQDKRMDLCKQVVGPSWIGMLMGALKQNTQVEHFLLGNNIIGETGGKAVGDFLLSEHKAKIKTWYLAGNDLNSKAIEHVVNGLESDTDCVNLWLKRNPLKPEGIKHIARLLKVNKFIKVLDLHNTAVFDEGLSYLVEGLKENRTLRHLYLDANGITSNGIKYLIDYFEYLVTNNLEGISSFWFDMNNIGDEGIMELVGVLGKYRYLKRLNLGSTGITEKAIPSIVNAFKSHPNLLVLDLGMYKSTSDMGMITNNMGDNGIELLGELIKQNSTLQFLSVVMNGLTTKGIEILNDAIQSNNTIMYLDWAQYGIDVPQKLSTQLRNKIDTNRTNAGFTRRLRNLKHGEQIHRIDSIYRNNMK